VAWNCQLFEKRRSTWFRRFLAQFAEHLLEQRRRPVPFGGFFRSQVVGRFDLEASFSILLVPGNESAGAAAANRARFLPLVDESS
jgi:hypothetical protein